MTQNAPNQRISYIQSLESERVFVSDSIKDRIKNVGPPQHVVGTTLILMLEKSPEKQYKFTGVSFKQLTTPGLSHQVIFELPYHQAVVISLLLINKVKINADLFIGEAKCCIANEINRYAISFDDCGPNIGYRVELTILN